MARAARKNQKTDAPKTNPAAKAAANEAVAEAMKAATSNEPLTGEEANKAVEGMRKQAEKTKGSAKNAEAKAKGGKKKGPPANETPEQKAAREQLEAAEKEAKDAEKAAEAKRKEAEKAANKLKRQQALADAREAKKKEKEAAEKEVAEHLASAAKEINVRMEKALSIEGKADDHRLAACLKLAEAEKYCGEKGVNFKNWCVANVKHSYESIRKMLPIAKAPDPAAALADWRRGNAERNRKMREERAAAAAERAQVTDQSSKSRGNNSPAESPFQRAQAVVASLEDRSKLNLATSIAESSGMRVVSEADAKRLIALKDAEESGQSAKDAEQAAKDAFAKLGATAQLNFATWVAEEVGGTFTHELLTRDPLDPIPGMDFRKKPAEAAE